MDARLCDLFRSDHLPHTHECTINKITQAQASNWTVVRTLHHFNPVTRPQYFEMENLTFDGDGANPSFVQKRLIDWGAFAEVHEVSFQKSIIAATESLIISMKIVTPKRCFLHL